MGSCFRKPDVSKSPYVIITNKKTHAEDDYLHNAALAYDICLGAETSAFLASLFEVCQFLHPSFEILSVLTYVYDIFNNLCSPKWRCRRRFSLKKCGDKQVKKAMNKDFLYSKYARKMFWWLGLRMNVEN